MVDFVPIKKGFRKNKCLWVDYKTRKKLKVRKRKWQIYRKSNDELDYVKYKKARNDATKALRKARKKFERRLASNVKTNPKSFYRYVRSISKTKDAIGPLKDNEGQVVNDDRTMCGLLNNFL